MDPSSDAAYDVLWRALRGAAELFPDAKLHVGGDEVDLGCWRGSARVREWAEKQQQKMRMESAAAAAGAEGNRDPKNRDPIEQAFAAFVSRAVGMAAAAGRAAVVWQEAFEAGADLPPTAEVEVWKVRISQLFFFYVFLVFFVFFFFLFRQRFFFLRSLALSFSSLTKEREREKKKHKNKNSKFTLLVVGGQRGPFQRRRDDGRRGEGLAPRAGVGDRVGPPRDPGRAVVPEPGPEGARGLGGDVSSFFQVLTRERKNARRRRRSGNR